MEFSAGETLGGPYGRGDHLRVLMSPVAGGRDGLTDQHRVALLFLSRTQSIGEPVESV